MHIELLEMLRCPASHEPAPLVAGLDRMLGRDVREGSLGCFVCGARFAIRDGVADLRLPAGSAGDAPSRDRHTTETPAGALEAAAYLGIAEGSTVLLVDEWAAVAAGILAMLPVRIVTIGAPADPADPPDIARLLADGVPLAAGSLHAAALGGRADPALVGGALRALRPRGRLLLPAAALPPDGTTRLAADDVWQILEVDPVAASAPVQLRTARGS